MWPASSALSRIALVGGGCFALLLALAWSGRTAGEPSSFRPTARFNVNMSVLGGVRRGAMIQVRGEITAAFASPSVEVRFVTPAGTTATGETSWTGSLAAGQSIVLTFPVRIDQAGVWPVSVVVADTTEVASQPDLVKDAWAGSYLVAGKQQGFVEQNFSERLVPPGRRALGELLEKNPVPTAEQKALKEGEVLYGSSGPAVATELGTALAQIDAQGVEALLEDSATQVLKVKTALKKDKDAGKQRRTASLQLAAPVPMSQQQVMACPAGYVLRPGHVDFLNTNSGLRQRLPNILVYASSGPPTFPGNWTTWRSRADGTFNACVPYDPNGRTYITTYQDIGPVFMFRDGASPPSTFPTWYGKAWDLNVSMSLPIDTRHSEVSFALSTFYQAITASYSIFTARRSQVNAWYYTTTDLDRYCTGYDAPFGNCTRTGENIYVHLNAPTTTGGSINAIYTPYGRFARAHEYGHAYDNKVLGDIGGGCSGNHSYHLPNNLGCAVNEGWADFFAQITLPLVNLNSEVWVGTTNRGPEIEASVAAYLFDLIDNSTFPSPRSPSTDDDPVKVTGDYLVAVFKNGRTNLGKVKSVQELIALVDDVTPVSAKSEFTGYTQPTSLSVRVARPSTITVAQNRVIWRKDVFGLVDPPPPPPPSFIVTAGAPDYITVKSTYALTGSANASASGWRWDRGDNGGPYSLWANAQNSQFVAYAGDYYIGWRLFARRNSDGVTDYGFATTTVCIQSTPCGGGPIAVMAGHDLGSSGVRVGMPGGGTDPSIVALDSGQELLGEHFGAGAWISAEGAKDSSVIQLYSLAGDHYAWTPQQPRPNSFARPAGALARWRAGMGDGEASLSEVRTQPGPGASVVRFRAQDLGMDALYRVSFAVDPDLGTRAGDDRFVWLDSLGIAAVVDADGGAIAYGYATATPGLTVSAREYASTLELRQPLTTNEAYREQRALSRQLGTPGDVRFILSAGPLHATAGGKLELSLAHARGKTLQEAVATLQSVRQQVVLALGGGDGSGRPAEFALRQVLPAGARASFSSTGALQTGAAQVRSQLREFGITALEYAVPDGKETDVRILVYSNRGQLVRTLVREFRTSGRYHVEWDKLNERGERVPPGVYVAVMEATGFRTMRKLVVTR